MAMIRKWLSQLGDRFRREHNLWFNIASWIIILSAVSFFIWILIRGIFAEPLSLIISILGLGVSALGAIFSFIQASPILAQWVHKSPSSSPSVGKAEGVVTEESDNDKSIWGRPWYLTTAHFIERDEILQNLHSAMEVKNPQKRKPLVITGGRGDGKTLTALAYAENKRSAYGKVLWINASSIAAVKASCASIARILAASDHLPGQDTTAIPGTSPDPVELVLSWLAANRNWLLILDGCETIDLKLNDTHPRRVNQQQVLLLGPQGQPLRNGANPEQEEWEQFLEAVVDLIQQGFVVLTTNQSPVPASYREVRIPQWQENDGARLLQQQISKLKNTEADKEEIKEDAVKISRQLSNFPCALNLAATTIYEQDGDFKRFLTEFEEKQKDFEEKQKDFGTKQGAFSDALLATFQVLVDEIAKRPAMERNLLKFCVAFDSELIPIRLIKSAPDFIDDPTLSADQRSPEGIKAAIDAVRRLQFVTDRGDALGIEPVLHRLLSKQYENERERWAKIAVRALSSSLEKIPFAEEKAPFEDWKQMRLYLAHLRRCYNYIEVYSTLGNKKAKENKEAKHSLEIKEALQLFSLGAYYLNASGRYGEAEEALDQAEALFQNLESGGVVQQASPEWITYLNARGEWYQAHNRYAQAVAECYEPTLAIYQKLAVGATAYLEIVSAASAVCSNGGMLFERIYEVLHAPAASADDVTAQQAAGSEDDPAYMLARSYYDDALEGRKKVYELAKQNGQPTVPALCELICAFSDLAWLYYRHRQYAKVSQLLHNRRYEEIFEQCQNLDDFRKQIKATGDAVSSDNKEARLDAFIRFHDSIRKAFKGMLGSHPCMVRCYMRLGTLYARRGYDPQALSCYFRARDISQLYLGDGQPLVALLSSELAKLYLRKGNLREARYHHLQAIDVIRQAREQHVPWPLAVQENYARFLQRTRRQEDSQTRKRVEEMRKNVEVEAQKALGEERKKEMSVQGGSSTARP